MNAHTMARTLGQTYAIAPDAEKNGIIMAFAALGGTLGRLPQSFADAAGLDTMPGAASTVKAVKAETATVKAVKAATIPTIPTGDTPEHCTALRRNGKRCGQAVWDKWSGDMSALRAGRCKIHSNRESYKNAPDGMVAPAFAKAAEDNDPYCVCGVARSEHRMMGCPEGFQTPAQWNAWKADKAEADDGRVICGAPTKVGSVCTRYVGLGSDGRCRSHHGAVVSTLVVNAKPSSVETTKRTGKRRVTITRPEHV